MFLHCSHCLFGAVREVSNATSSLTTSSPSLGDSNFNCLTRLWLPEACFQPHLVQFAMKKQSCLGEREKRKKPACLSLYRLLHEHQVEHLVDCFCSLKCRFKKKERNLGV
ncbi:hypothetical protein KC19_VG071700 [Ceratodon purpureus]|uniref:Uncharacterized protein n=1 Tax=Ceratodon purpureus TaxID=3225 RepID=A0A8T0HNF1_CERPU|nr:hypothetical protein KC19_VG071700 [Ceratodon purpureus]